MARKVGFFSMRKFAKLVCKFTLEFGPIVRQVYPSSPTLHAAIDAANAACALLVIEIDLVAPVGV